jgi:predicted dehydrogenase
MRTFADPQALVREPIDGVVVEGRVIENLALARIGLDAGKPVMLEKPPGENLDEHRKLIDLAQSKNLHVQMIYLFRYMSAVQEMLRRVRAGELGHIYHYRARLPKDIDLYDEYVRDLGRYQGGMFFEMAGHVVDMMIALLGPPRRVTPFLAHHHRGNATSFIDNGVVVFEYADALATIEVPALEVAPQQRRLEIFGTEGAIVIPHMGSGHLKNANVQPIEIYRRGAADWETLALPAQTLQIRDLREFAAILKGKSPAFSMDHDFLVQETLLKASGMLG